MKKCPACAEEIQDEAIKCKHCGSSVPVESALTKHYGPKLNKKTEQTAAFVIFCFVLGIGIYLFLQMQGAGGAAPSISLPKVTLDPNAPHTVQINLSGSAEGFQGSYGDMTGQTSVEGRLPQSYSIQAKGVVSVSFQKKGEGGDLTVELVSDGKTLDRKSTSAAYGIVSAAANL